MAQSKISQETMLKADEVTLYAKAEKDGKLRLRVASWSEPKIVLPGQAASTLVVKAEKDGKLRLRGFEDEATDPARR